MKKLTAILLALVMVFALGVYAFATETIDTEEKLISAIASAGEGDTVTLGGDITLTSTLVIGADKNFTLDLNDYDIYLDGTGTAIKVESGAIIFFDYASYRASQISSKNGVTLENYGSVLQRYGVLLYSDTDYALKNYGTYNLESGGICGESDKAVFYNAGEFYQDGGSVINYTEYTNDGYKGYVFEMDNNEYPDAKIVVTSGDLIGYIGDYNNEGKAVNVELIQGHFSYFDNPSGDGASFSEYISDDAEAYVYDGYGYLGYSYTHLFADFQEALDYALEWDMGNVHALKKLDGIYYIKETVKDFLIKYPKGTDIPDIRATNGYKIKFNIEHSEEYGDSVYATVTIKESDNPIIVGEKANATVEENPNTGAPVFSVVPAMALLAGVALMLTKKHR